MLISDFLLRWRSASVGAVVGVVVVAAIRCLAIVIVVLQALGDVCLLADDRAHRQGQSTEIGRVHFGAKLWSEFPHRSSSSAFGRSPATLFCRVE